jgi:hypothetical protein
MHAHAHMRVYACFSLGERERFAFVVLFDCGKVRLGKWWFTLGNYLDICATFVYGSVIAQVMGSNVWVNFKISEAVNSGRPRDWVVF